MMQTQSLETSFEATDAVRAGWNDRTPVSDRALLLDAMVEHKKYLQRMAFSVLHHTEDAEDAVQAAYLSAWTAWANFRGQSSLKTWLTTIVMNKALSELRTKRRRTWVSMEDDPALMMEAEWQMSSGQTSPEQQAIREETLRQVQEQVRALPVQTQQVIALRYESDLSVDEVAAVSRISRAAVKGHLYRGCSALRKGVRVIPKASRGVMFGERRAANGVPQ